MMATVSLHNLSKTYAGKIAAVRGLSLDINDGEFMVIVGPSGCGKTTTLRLIAGLEQPTSGEVVIGDRVVNALPPRDRDIAMVFQSYALYPHMSVYRNMAFALKLRGIDRAEIDRRVRDAASLLGITDLLNRRPHALSGGQRQRVAVGRAIVRHPACFLYDEPLSNLDVTLRHQMRTELKRLHHRLRTTTIYVTHDQEEAMTLGERVAVMAEGEQQQCAPPMTIYHEPANRCVAGFVGTPAMNFLDGRLTSEQDQLYLESVTDKLPLPWRVDELATGCMGHNVVLGLRPESLRPVAALETAPLRMTVQLVEPLGDRMDVSGITPGNQQLVARLPSTLRCKPGDVLPLEVRAVGMHLFAPGPIGQRLTRSGTRNLATDREMRT